MYQFDFIRTDEDTENVISVMAHDYQSAVKKMRSLGLPGFDLTEWTLEGVYESGTIIPANN